MLARTTTSKTYLVIYKFKDQGAISRPYVAKFTNSHDAQEFFAQKIKADNIAEISLFVADHIQGNW